MSRCVHLFLQSITPITAKRSRKTDSKTPPNPRGLSLRGCFLPVPQFALAFHVSSTLILEQPGNQWVKKHIIAETKHLQIVETSTVVPTTSPHSIRPRVPQ
ncbi:hypothetical protein V6N13_029423 [Hibiscus sabdariffa]